MKRIFSLFLSLLLTLSLFACGKTVEQKWQEQYDTGMRYLSELNYEEAIVAFTMAIETEPKNTAAYLGRAEAYVAQAKASAPPSTEIKDWPEDLVRLYKLAENDYLTAIGIDKELAEAYLKLADLYIEQGEMDKAREILEEGFNATGDAGISQKQKELDSEEIPEENDESQETSDAAESESEEIQGIPVESTVISGDLAISDLQSIYAEDGELVELNEGMVGEFHLSFTVDGPAEVTDADMLSVFFDRVPSQEEIQEDIDEIVPTWKDENTEPVDQSLPFSVETGYPILPIGLETTAHYAVLVGLNQNGDVVAHAVVQISTPR